MLPITELLYYLRHERERLQIVHAAREFALSRHLWYQRALDLTQLIDGVLHSGKQEGSRGGLPTLSAAPSPLVATNGIGPTPVPTSKVATEGVAPLVWRTPWAAAMGRHGQAREKVGLAGRRDLAKDLAERHPRG
uniref:Uncharacterized protein n=1 Tax=Haptolina ericina TaxID=156174 RepID=A0A7S3EUI8_9EUKA|mmetsp:Transcript_25091/g.57160  ORF Transcript_25091/g.57160 Transcript_25091/m.57160 type:complete len:135 (+) Transcript_25091:57-461(+)